MTPFSKQKEKLWASLHIQKTFICPAMNLGKKEIERDELPHA